MTYPFQKIGNRAARQLPLPHVQDAPQLSAGVLSSTDLARPLTVPAVSTRGAAVTRFSSLRSTGCGARRWVRTSVVSGHLRWMVVLTCCPSVKVRVKVPLGGVCPRMTSSSWIVCYRLDHSVLFDINVVSCCISIYIYI